MVEVRTTFLTKDAPQGRGLDLVKSSVRKPPTAAMQFLSSLGITQVEVLGPGGVKIGTLALASGKSIKVIQNDSENPFLPAAAVSIPDSRVAQGKTITVRYVESDWQKALSPQGKIKTFADVGATVTLRIKEAMSLYPSTNAPVKSDAIKTVSWDDFIKGMSENVQDFFETAWQAQPAMQLEIPMADGVVAGLKFPANDNFKQPIADNDNWRSSWAQDVMMIALRGSPLGRLLAAIKWGMDIEKWIEDQIEWDAYNPKLRPWNDTDVGNPFSWPGRNPNAIAMTGRTWFKIDECLLFDYPKVGELYGPTAGLPVQFFSCENIGVLADLPMYEALSGDPATANWRNDLGTDAGQLNVRDQWIPVTDPVPVPIPKVIPVVHPEIDPFELPIEAPIPDYRPIPYHMIPWTEPPLEWRHPNERTEKGYEKFPELERELHPQVSLLPGRPAINQPVTSEVLARVGPGRKDNKGSTRVQAKVALKVVSETTEACEAIASVWKALPKSARSHAPGAAFRGGKPQRVHRQLLPTCQAMLGDIYKSAGQIDLGKALTNLAVDQITDFLYGSVGKQAAKEAIRNGKLQTLMPSRLGIGGVGL